MITPPKGDYASVPLNAEGRARWRDVWDPAKDEASGNQCKCMDAANIMRVPGRLHITRQNDSTLKVDTDAGTQSRVLHFGDATLRRATRDGRAIPSRAGKSPARRHAAAVVADAASSRSAASCSRRQAMPAAAAAARRRRDTDR